MWFYIVATAVALAKNAKGDPCVFPNSEGWAVITKSSQIKAWGSEKCTASSEDLNENGPFWAMAATDCAFSGIRYNGSVAAFGDVDSGGNLTEPLDNVVAIYSTEISFVALHKNMSLTSWGHYNGAKGEYNYLDQSPTEKVVDSVKSVAVTARDFCVLSEDGSAIVWGPDWDDLINDYYDYDANDATDLDLDNVNKVVGNRAAFAALMLDGSVQAWGMAYTGGSDTNVPAYGPRFEHVQSQLVSGVVDVVASEFAFAARLDDGSVVTWGARGSGGDSSEVNFTGGVKEIVANRQAFAAITLSGQVLTWGSPHSGGDDAVVNPTGQVTSIYATDSSFAALQDDGSVVAWGNPENGGDITAVDFPGPVESIVANSGAFTAVLSSGTVVSWGSQARGGNSSQVDFRGLQVDQVYAHEKGSSFLALLNDDSIVVWGDPEKGGSANLSEWDGVKRSCRSDFRTYAPTVSPSIFPTSTPTISPTSTPTFSPTVPHSNAPVTDAPVTGAPVTGPPVTGATVTNAPVSNEPSTGAPASSPATYSPTLSPTIITVFDDSVAEPRSESSSPMVVILVAAISTVFGASLLAFYNRRKSTPVAPAMQPRLPPLSPSGGKPVIVRKAF